MNKILEMLADISAEIRRANEAEKIGSMRPDVARNLRNNRLCEKQGIVRTLRALGIEPTINDMGEWTIIPYAE